MEPSGFWRSTRVTSDLPNASMRSFGAPSSGKRNRVGDATPSGLWHILQPAFSNTGYSRSAKEIGRAGPAGSGAVPHTTAAIIVQNSIDKNGRLMYTRVIMMLRHSGVNVSRNLFALLVGAFAFIHLQSPAA